MITTLPTPPSRQRPTEFSNEADAFLGALPAFGTEANALAVDVNNKQTTASAAADTATTKASEASASAASALASKNSAELAATEATGLTEKYQGALTADPTLDKTGSVLTSGDWYVNTITGFIRAYNGSTWVNSVNASAGVSSLNGLSGDLIGFTTNTGSQVLTNKTLTAPTIVDGYTEEIYTASLSGSIVLTLTNGSIQVITHTGAITFTDSLTSGQSMLLGLTPGANTTTWPTITWTKVGGSGIAPTLTATGVNWIVLWKINSTLRGSFLGTA